MAKPVWQVWTNEVTDAAGNLVSYDVVFTGSYTKCLAYYKRHGGAYNGFHIGHDC